MTTGAGGGGRPSAPRLGRAAQIQAINAGAAARRRGATPAQAQRAAIAAGRGAGLAMGIVGRKRRRT